MKMHNRPYDIIVFGATGFTGKLVVEYLIEHYGVNNKLFTWAIAGRNENKIKKLVETNFSYVRIRGEISRPSFPGSGHVYFTLKDTDGTIAAIIWKYTLPRLSIKPEEGIEVICTGKVTTFAGQSKYQIIVESMEVAGEGALLKMLEDRRKKLLKEGLFNQEFKKPNTLTFLKL